MTQTKSAAELKAAVVEAYAEALKDAYVKLRKRWRPDYSGHLSTNDTTWLACATVLADNNLDPYCYAQYVFDVYMGVQPDVYENQVTSQKLVTSFVKERPKMIEKAKLRVRIQADQISNRISRGETLDIILNDELNGISPIFAYAAAWSEKKFILADQFKEDALRMLLFEPLYAELLGQYLPEEMKNAAGRS